MHRRLTVVGVTLALVATLLIPADPARGQPGSGPGYGPYGDVNLLFSERGDPAAYGGNRLVRIEAGNINFVKGCEEGPTGQAFDDWFQAAADLYVVGGGTPISDGSPLSPIAGRKRSVFGGLGGSFLNVPVLMTAPAGPLGTGVYDVVVDECQNGQFDAGIDSVVRGAFRVDSEELVPGFDFDGVNFREMKRHAAAAARDMVEMQRGLTLIELHESMKEVSDAAQAAAGGVTGFMGFVISDFADKLNPINALKNRAKEGMKNVLAQRKSGAIALAQDPPDPDFQRFAAPSRELPSLASDLDEPRMVELYGAITDLDQLQSIEGALLDALERYQGAQLAGNPVWALRHARTLAELAELHGQLGPDLADRLHAAFAPYVDDPALPNWMNSVRSSMGQLESQHPTRSVRFWNSGASLAEAELATDTWLEVKGGVPTPTVHGAGGAAAKGQAGATRIAEMSAAVTTWADGTLDDMIADLESYLGDRDVDPVAVIAPVVDAPAGGEVTLDASGSSAAPDGTQITEWAWDLDGNGEFGDAFDATPTWQIPGDAVAGSVWLVGVQVSAGDGGRAVAHLPVTITEGNRRPELVLTDPGYRTAMPGDDVLFEVASATDPDGDPVELTWFIEDEQVEVAGLTHTLELPDDTFGVLRVDVFGADPGGARTMAGWTVDVRPAVDADRDGYYAWPGPDCDDDDSRVHPGMPEVLDNGKDDDCNPDTPDDGGNPSGNAAFPTPGWFFDGVTGDVTMVRVTGWTHPSRYQDVPFTMTVDWADGSTSEQTVQGSNYAETVFELEHRYTEPVRGGVVSYCITYSGGLVACNQSPPDAVHIAGSPPMVNAADLRTWEIDRSGEAGVCVYACDTTSNWTPRDPDGRYVLSTGNPNEPLVAHSPVELAEDGYGRAMVELSSEGGDDDAIGFVLGYLPEEIADGAISPPHEVQNDADFLGFTWRADGRRRWTNISQCSDGDYTFEEDVWEEMAVAWRQRGMPLFEERRIHTTFAFPDESGTQDPRCNDEYGLERLAVVNPFPEGARTHVNRQTWLRRSHDQGRQRLAPQAPIADPYLFTIDYRADRLQVWMDGIPIIDVAPSDPADPFPPGSLGLYTMSNPGTRGTATRPEPGFRFVQGTAGPITMPFADGDGPNDTHTAIINWGDGSPQSTGIVAADSDTGYGWFEASAEHAYQRAGEHRGEVCVTDAADRGSCFTFRATVENLPPVVEAGPRVLTEGEFEGEGRLVTGAEVTLEETTFFDPGAYDTHTATIDWGVGAGPVAGEVVQSPGSHGGTVTGTHDYTEDGIYEVEVCVTDQHDATGCDTVEVEVRATNVAPVALLDVADGVAGVPVRFGAGFTDDNPGDTHEVTLDPGDGSGPAPLERLQAGRGVGQGSLDHVYAEAGTYTVEACVSDQHDASDCTDAQVTIEAAPSTDVEVSLDALDGTAEGDEVTLSGSYAAPEGVEGEAAGGDVTVTVDPGDGSPAVDAVVDEEASRFSAAHVFRQDGEFDVEATVCIDVDWCGTDTIGVSVSNVAPSVDAGRDRTTHGTVTLDDTTFTDPGVDDTHTATVDWGDGDGPVDAAVTFGGGAGTVQATHTYDAPGTFVVDVCVTDDAATGCDSFEVTVAGEGTVVVPADLTVSVEEPDAIDEGDTVEVAFSFADEDEGGPYTATVRWSDGSDPEVVDLEGSNGSTGHRYLDDGVYAVTVEVCDGQRCGVGTTSVTVANVAPVVAVPSGTVDGGTLSLTSEFTDPGVFDVHTATVDWGDGTTTPASVEQRDGGGTVSGTHTYAEQGTSEVEVCVTDDDGATGCASASFEVAGAPDEGEACPPDRVPRAGFVDTVANTHETAIDCAAWYGLAHGRTATTYVPGEITTRSQMASFLLRLLQEAGAELPEGDHPFDDLDGGPHDAAIGVLHELGIVRGTTATRFDPRQPVQRDQMAAFIVRTYEHLEGSLPTEAVAFTDIDGNVHRSDIEKATTAGFALGRHPTLYQPHEGTQRDQMASFLTRVLEALHDAGRITPPDRR